MAASGSSEYRNDMITISGLLNISYNMATMDKLTVSTGETETLQTRYNKNDFLSKMFFPSILAVRVNQRKKIKSPQE